MNASDSKQPDEPVLLAGGNPQIAKGDGDAPVQAFIAAAPGWKGDRVARLDAVITAAVPEVRKAVRWNTPFYGVADNGWFVSYHLFTKYVKVGFLNGDRLVPPPPIAAADPHVRYLHIAEDDRFDADQLADWMTQAASFPGQRLF